MLTEGFFDSTLTARLAQWTAVYAAPAGALLAALKAFVKLCKKHGKTCAALTPKPCVHFL